MKKRLLILCTGNSCRSQMAEGWFRHFGEDQFEVYSAGVETHGVNPDAVKVMKETGIDISGHTSNHVDEYDDVDFDIVLTVCDHAKERCPVLPGNARQVHHNFTDPASAKGSKEERLEVFRQVRDEIRDFAQDFVQKNG